MQLIGAKLKKAFSGKLYNGEVIGFDPKVAYYKVHFISLICLEVQMVCTGIWNISCINSYSDFSSICCTFLHALVLVGVLPYACIYQCSLCIDIST